MAINGILKSLKVLPFLMVLFSVSSLSAQSKVYQCDFENIADHSKWTLNAGNQGATCANKWYLGRAGSNGGYHGLFVSKNGNSNEYEATDLTVVAYTNIHLDAGRYEFSFDWRAFGWQDSISDVDGLYVCLVPDTTIKTNSLKGQTLPSYIKQYSLKKKNNGDPEKFSQSDWNTLVDTVDFTGVPYKLVFAWHNGSAGTYPPAACVDNILIMPEGYCHKPYNLNLEVNDLDATFSWSGDVDSYDVRCYNNRTKKWKEYQNIKDTFVVVEGVEEGMCTYSVRSRCEGISGTWVSISQFIYYPGSRCIDYLSLSTKNCFTGLNPNNSDGSGVGLGFNSGLVDEGYQSIESRHTIHYDLDERDPRTDGKLRTVPEGEIASVRLGNWNTGGEAERIEYRYTVDAASSAVLILKYAVVLQDPEHNAAWQPKFELEIFVDGKPISCGEAKFTAGKNTLAIDGWHKFGTGWWKDWTTVSIGLLDYDGKEVMVRLSTFDCGELGHFGYAYFTLDCSDGQLKSTACGDVPNDTLVGPEGFKYRWYKESKKDSTCSREQTYIISTSDTAVYCLDVINPTKEECYYTLKTSGLQRYPVASGKCEPFIEDCMNRVRFTNNSYVLEKDAKGNDVKSMEMCDILWDFGDGSTSSNLNPVHEYPREGGKYTAKLRASIGGGKCEEIESFEFELPNLSDIRDTVRATICPGGIYTMDGKSYIASGVYADTVLTEYGCNSIKVLYLDVLTDTIMYDTICSADVRYIDGVRVTKTGKYPIKSSLGCDSIIWDILVNESLVLGVDSIVTVCVDDPSIIIPYVEHSGKLLKYNIEFADEEFKKASAKDLEPNNSSMVIPMVNNIKPNRYKATLSFGDLSCGSDDIDVMIDVRYSNSVIAQRWDDVLAVKNSDYNGNYEFIEYQWYKNNEPIEGATSSVLYVEEGLDVTAQYSVLLTREDGVKAMVCAVQPILFSPEESGSVVFSLGDALGVKTSQDALVRMWSSMGFLVQEYRVEAGESLLSLGARGGVYLLEFIFADGTRATERVVIH